MMCDAADDEDFRRKIAAVNDIIYGGGNISVVLIYNFFIFF